MLKERQHRTALKPGGYQVRCQILDGYVYYGQDGKEAKGQKGNRLFGEILQVEEDKTLSGIDFRFAPFKKGTWKNYDTLDGLAENVVMDIYRDISGVMWFGTYNKGVSLYDGKEFTNFTTQDGLVSNRIRIIYGDTNGVM